ncbi:uncharacterized protein LOC119689929 isoform X2 [Teleopsis dalmanni]|uniref:uncharacterized protein LOC119689929 isoform X2 n=1 Tax=Teleopsis dalmanni TaxID=139649 RepID=UPI0018CFE059|nr:uncharacterized protein LOC119689929 isoform X2 [Teleopsis dalmanni]
MSTEQTVSKKYNHNLPYRKVNQYPESAHLVSQRQRTTEQQDTPTQLTKHIKSSEYISQVNSDRCSEMEQSNGNTTISPSITCIKRGTVKELLEKFEKVNSQESTINIRPNAQVSVQESTINADKGNLKYHGSSKEDIMPCMGCNKEFNNPNAFNSEQCIVNSETGSNCDSYSDSNLITREQLLALTEEKKREINSFKKRC